MDTKRNIILRAALFIILFIPQCFQILHAQEIVWERTYGFIGDDRAYGVQQTTDDGFIIAGRADTLNSGDKDIYLVKTDSEGEAVWTTFKGGEANDYNFDIIQTSDGGYLLAGASYSYGGTYERSLVIKTYSNGNSFWTRTYYSSDYWHCAFANVEDTDGDFISAGYGYNPVRGYDFYVVKTNQMGSTVYEEYLGGNSTDIAYDLSETNDGGCIVVGGTQSFSSGEGNVYVIKLDTNGDTLWTGLYGGSSLDIAYAVDEVGDDGYIIAGETNSFGAGGVDFYLIRIDGYGNEIWSRTYGDSGDEMAKSVEYIGNGFIIGGFTESYGNGGKDMYLIRTDLDGDTLWTATYGGSGEDQCESVVPADNGDFVAAGWTESFGVGNMDFYVIRVSDGYTDIDETPALSCVFELNGNYPNPFNATTGISFTIPEYGDVDIAIYNINGQKVNSLQIEQATPGSHSVIWDGKDDYYNSVSSGVYFYRINFSNQHLSGQMTLLK